MQNRTASDLVLKFYRKFIKIPKLIDSEWPAEEAKGDEAKSLN